MTPHPTSNVVPTAIYTRAEYIGKNGKVRWKKQQDGIFDGFIDFERVFGRGNLDWVTAYAWTAVNSPDERQVQLRIGSNDSVRIWLNGIEVFALDQTRSAAVDQDIIPVILQAGENSIRFKVCKRDGAWGFYLRMTNMDGQPLDDLELGYGL